MASPYVGEIRLFAGSFAPVGWQPCDGRLLPISENETLFQLIGTIYGGDGEETFALPDLRGRLPVHQPAANTIGTMAGVEEVTLTVSQTPTHTHPLVAAQSPGSQTSPIGNLYAESPGGVQPYIEDVPGINMAAGAVSAAGGSQPHNNLQPFLVLMFIISQYGLFPSPT